MADKAAFVGAFRAGVITLLQAHNSLKDLREQYTALGYDATSLGPVFGVSPNADLTVTDFVGAVSSDDALETFLASGHLTNFYKLKF